MSDMNFETEGVVDWIINNEGLYLESERILKRSELSAEALAKKGISAVGKVFDMIKLRRRLRHFILSNGIIRQSGVYKNNPSRQPIDYDAICDYFAHCNN